MTSQKKYSAPEGFKKLLKKQIQKEGISIRKLAKKADISSSHLTYILNGSRRPSDENIVNLAEALNMNPIDLQVEAGRLPEENEQMFALLRAAKEFSTDDLKILTKQMEKYVREKRRADNDKSVT